MYVKVLRVWRNHLPKGYTSGKYFEQSYVFSIWNGVCFFFFLSFFFEKAFYNIIMVPLELRAGFFFYPLLYLQLLFP